MRTNSLTVLYPLLWNFACVFFMIWGCACGLDIIVRSFFFFFFFFFIFSTLWTSHFSPSIYRRPVGTLWPQLTHFYTIFLKLCTCFSIIGRCACVFHVILALFFVTFFYFLNFVFFWPQMYKQWVPYDCNLSYNFKPVFFETLHMFSPGSAEVHIVWIWFLNFFLAVENRNRNCYWWFFKCQSYQDLWYGKIVPSSHPGIVKDDVTG